jgi:hypothetical protein
MKQIQSVILLPILLMLSMFFAGCEVYDCEAAETEITTMQVNLSSQPWVENATFTKCNQYADKITEYTDEGCGASQDASLDCEEFTCTIMFTSLFTFGIGQMFADSVTYCTYYDSIGYAMQEMVNAGGCGSYTLDGVAITQAMVDAHTSDGCDYGATTVNSVIPGQGGLTKVNIRGSNELLKFEELLDQIPDNYSSPMRKRLNRILAD